LFHRDHRVWKTLSVYLPQLALLIASQDHNIVTCISNYRREFWLIIGFIQQLQATIALSLYNSLLLRYNVIYSVESQPTFRRNISLPSSGSNDKPSKKESCKQVARRRKCRTFNRLHGVVSQKVELPLWEPQILQVLLLFVWKWVLRQVPKPMSKKLEKLIEDVRAVSYSIYSSTDTITAKKEEWDGMQQPYVHTYTATSRDYIGE
jgi:hypothetical protein